MESAKTQISLPDFTDTFVPQEFVSVFIETTPPETHEIPVKKVPEQVSEPEEDKFLLEGNFLSLLMNDVGVQTEIKSKIEAGVTAIIDGRWEEEQKKIEPARVAAQKEGFEKGHADGYAEGLEIARKATEEAIALHKAMEQKMAEEFKQQFFDRMNVICGDILKAKQALLVEHEKIWAQGMLHLLKRFQVGRSVELGAGLDQWLGEAVSEFAEKKKIKIFLSPVEYSLFQKRLEYSGTEAKWELCCDESLQDGESRYESDGGGVFLSTGAEFKKLEKWLADFEGSKFEEVEVEIPQIPTESANVETEGKAQ